MAIRDELAHFCKGLSFDALPQDVVEYTKLCFLDQISHMVVGRTTFLEDYPDIAKFMKDFGGSEESSIILTGDKLPCPNATLVNTAFGISTSFDPVHKSTIIHLSAVLFPAAIAVAEKQRASGRDLILSIIAGAEIMTRVGISLNRRNANTRRFHFTSICGPFGCAATAGKLLGLGEKELANALSLSAVQAAGTTVWEGGLYPTSWSFQGARAAQSGVLSAMLAQIGFIGPETIFENERGFLKAHSENPDPTKLTEGLGKRYEIKELTLKRFSVGVYMFTSIDTLLDMLERYKIVAENIDEIRVNLSTLVMPLVGLPEYPRNRASTYTNTRYILAVTALMGNRIIYSTEVSGAKNREDPAIKDMFHRVKIVGDAQLDNLLPEKKACIVTIKTKDGKEVSQRNDGPFKGDPENPLSKEDIEEKFNTMTIPILGQEKASQIMSMVKQLDRLKDVSQLVELLTT